MLPPELDEPPELDGEIWFPAEDSENQLPPMA